MGLAFARGGGGGHFHDEHTHYIRGQGKWACLDGQLRPKCLCSYIYDQFSYIADEALPYKICLHYMPQTEFPLPVTCDTCIVASHGI